LGHRPATAREIRHYGPGGQLRGRSRQLASCGPSGLVVPTIITHREVPGGARSSAPQSRTCITGSRSRCRRFEHARRAGGQPAQHVRRYRSSSPAAYAAKRYGSEYLVPPGPARFSCHRHSSCCTGRRGAAVRRAQPSGRPRFPAGLSTNAQAIAAVRGSSDGLPLSRLNLRAEASCHTPHMLSCNRLITSRTH